MEILDQFIKSRSHSRIGQSSIIFFSLFNISNRIATDIDNSLSDLTLKQLLLLIAVEIIQGGSYTELGNIMGSSRQNIKNLAIALEKKGYVSIIPDPNDSRAFKVISTERTKDHFEEMDLLYSKKLVELFSAFSDDEVAQLFALFDKFFQGVEVMERSNENF
ncbi:MarR family transcriptional regulator [Suicoccus acidiformans]|uniref:MarR family transcriptional regulator n=1 Tax=Suicoccus acidiformans TaxID=2036206 RepID=A0A347WMK2_9LACT|nr:MarR family transcriptional regulator [Suicoccus acidiformans]AXY26309.1 MarR family transcriptional regulator [Suicoccus acidiformans]